MKYRIKMGALIFLAVVIGVTLPHAFAAGTQSLYVLGGVGGSGGGSAPWGTGAGNGSITPYINGYTGNGGAGGDADATMGGGGGGGSGAYVGTEKSTVKDRGNGEDGGLRGKAGAGGKGINSLGTGAQSGTAGAPAQGRRGGAGGNGGDVDTVQSGAVFNDIDVYGGNQGGTGDTGDYLGGEGGRGGNAKLTLSQLDRVRARNIALSDGTNWVGGNSGGKAEMIVKAKQVDVEELRLYSSHYSDEVMVSLTIEGTLVVRQNASFYNYSGGKRGMAVDINALRVISTALINLNTTKPGDIRIEEIIIEDGRSLTIESRAGMMSVGSIEIQGDGRLIMKGGRDATEVIKLDGKWSPRVNGTDETRRFGNRDALKVRANLINNSFEDAVNEKTLTAVILSAGNEVTRTQATGVKANGKIQFAFSTGEQIEAIAGLPVGAYDIAVFAEKDERNFAIEETVVAQLSITSDADPIWSIPNQITVTKGFSSDFVRLDPDAEMPEFAIKNTKKKIAEVIDDFRISAKNKGKTVITLTDEQGLSQTCTVTVVNNVLSYKKPLRLNAPGIYTSTKKISINKKKELVYFEFFLLNCSGKPIKGLDVIDVYIADGRGVPEYETGIMYSGKFKKPLKNNTFRTIYFTMNYTPYSNYIADLDFASGRYQIAFGGTDYDGNSVTPLFPHDKGVIRDKKAVKASGNEELERIDDEAVIEPEVVEINEGIETEAPMDSQAQ